MPRTNILLINDASQLLRMLNCVFERKRYQTQVIDEVGIALEQIKTRCFDLVIIKLDSSRDDYLPVCRLIRELPPKTKLVLISEDERLAREADQLDLDDFIVLPCRFAELWRRVVKVLDSPKAGDSAEASPAPMPNKRALTALSLKFYQVRGALLSIAGGIEGLGKGVNRRTPDAFEAIIQDTNKRIAKLVAATEEVINGFFILEEMSEELG